MILEQQYAEALYALTKSSPQKSEEYLQHLILTLRRKGHQKLLPHIFTKYKSLLEKNIRSEGYTLDSPEQERTRVLLELYRKLIG